MTLYLRLTVWFGLCFAFCAMQAQAEIECKLQAYAAPQRASYGERVQIFSQELNTVLKSTDLAIEHHVVAWQRIASAFQNMVYTLAMHSRVVGSETQQRLLAVYGELRLLPEATQRGSRDYMPMLRRKVSDASTELVALDLKDLDLQPDNLVPYRTMFTEVVPTLAHRAYMSREGDLVFSQDLLAPTQRAVLLAGVVWVETPQALKKADFEKNLNKLGHALAELAGNISARDHFVHERYVYLERWIARMYASFSAFAAE